MVMIRCLCSVQTGHIYARLLSLIRQCHAAAMILLTLVALSLHGAMNDFFFLQAVLVKITYERFNLTKYRVYKMSRWDIDYRYVADGCKPLTCLMLNTFIRPDPTKVYSAEKKQKVLSFHHVGMDPRISISYCCRATSCTGSLGVTR